jgi:cobalt-precorrin 5A hydrolase
MNIAVVSVTAAGARLGGDIADRLPENCVLYEKNGRSGGRPAEGYDRLSLLVRDIWASYDAFIFIMAAGIVVREISSLLRHKTLDPAVVVLDEQGLNCISLLSGHLGGANRLTRLVSGLIGAHPVITTASDLRGLTAPDAAAADLNYAVEDFTALRRFNAALAAGEKVGFFLDPALPEKEDFQKRAAAVNLSFSLWRDEEDLKGLSGAALVSESARDISFAPLLYLRPRSLILGLGCQKGVPLAELETVLAEFFCESGYSLCGVCAICSAWLKEEEGGLRQLADKLRVPAYFYPQENLADSIKKHNLTETAFVKQRTGVGKVCEAAALSFCPTAALVRPKRRYRRITLALARVNFLSRA